MNPAAEPFDIYYDSLTEAVWFASLHPAFDLGRNRYHRIMARGKNIALIDRIVEYDKPDIILVQNGHPLLVLEVTQEVPSGHNVGQRVARLVRAVELGIPCIYYFPFDAMKHGGYAQLCHLNIRLLEAARKMYAIHAAPLLCVCWPTDRCGEIVVDGSENDALKRILASYVESGFDPKCAGITEQLALMQAEYDRRLHLWPAYGDLPPSVSRMKTADLITFYGLKAVPSSFAARPFTYIYKMLMSPGSCKRQDPYTGTTFIYDYLVCRTGPRVEDKQSNLALLFPMLDAAVWEENNPNDSTGKSCNWYLTANILLFKDGYLLIRG